VLHVRRGSIANQCESVLIFRFDARCVESTRLQDCSRTSRTGAQPNRCSAPRSRKLLRGWRLVMISGNNVNNPFVPVRTRTHTLFMNMWVNIVCRCENFCSDCQSIRLYIIRSSRQDSFLLFCCFFFLFFFSFFFFVVRSSFIPFRFKRFFSILSELICTLLDLRAIAGGEREWLIARLSGRGMLNAIAFNLPLFVEKKMARLYPSNQPSN